MFRAPLAESFLSCPPPFVRQLISKESLTVTGYFDSARVRHDCTLFAKGNGRKLSSFSNLGLVGVIATQLWHHLYFGGGLCELPQARGVGISKLCHSSQAETMSLPTM
jgi:asparagine synthase (glutamine-hydrolysing)